MGEEPTFVPAIDAKSREMIDSRKKDSLPRHQTVGQKNMHRRMNKHEGGEGGNEGNMRVVRVGTEHEGGTKDEGGN
jgi:hypothetical protein